jgi:hypothetical protein
MKPMARLSDKDWDDYYSEGLRKKYSEYPEVSRKTPSKKKDTQRWCKGKIDREHDFTSTDYYSKFTNRCNNCNMSISRVDKEVRARYDKEFAKRCELEIKWCSKGHLYDWVVSKQGLRETWIRRE